MATYVHTSTHPWQKGTYYTYPNLPNSSHGGGNVCFFAVKGRLKADWKGACSTQNENDVGYVNGNKLHAIK